MRFKASILFFIVIIYTKIYDKVDKLAVFVFTYILTALLEIALLVEHDAAVKFAFLNHRLVVQISSASETRVHTSTLIKCLITEID